MTPAHGALPCIDFQKFIQGKIRLHIYLQEMRPAGHVHLNNLEP